jgi:hypothetical protein
MPQVCTRAKPKLMLMELMPKGDLKTVLRANRPKKTAGSQFTFVDLAKMAARGLISSYCHPFA